VTRAAIYARYSSDLQRAASIEDQIRLCRERIAREGWRDLTAYTDAGLSGASRLRPGYQKLLEDARAGTFDIIVAEALDRLSRDQEDTAALYKHLSFAGVRLITLAEGEISELHVGLKGTMNALYLKDLAQKTKRGLEGRIRQGFPGGGNAYGYTVAKETDAWGDPVRGGRVIDPAEAAVVRRIFAAFAAGQSPRAIAKRLNAEGVPGPQGRPWGDTTIRGHATRRTGILRNALYVGQRVWNKQHYVKDPTTGKRLARPNPDSAWIVQAVPDLRIIDADLWEAVQRRLADIRETPAVQKAREQKFWLNRRAKHLLTGLAECGVCGGRLASVGRDYLACGRARQQGLCTNRHSIKRAVLESLILDALKDRLMAPDLVKAFVAEFHREINRQRYETDLRTTLRRRALEEVTRKLDGLIEAIADGLRTPGLKSKLEELEQRQAELAADLEGAPAPLPRLHPNLAELYRQKVAGLQQALADPAMKSEALEILRGLIERVVLRPVNGGFEVELVGAIARMIEAGLRDGNKKAASLEETAVCSVKVVAGAWNHRQLTGT
jgi:site-specific DNA recombinase